MEETTIMGVPLQFETQEMCSGTVLTWKANPHFPKLECLEFVMVNHEV